MAFFFFVVGLEARREFDMGELRERRRIALPVLAGIGGMAVPVLIYLAINVGGRGAHGWGAAMSTDTAFALGMLALVGPRSTDRLRVFMLTVFVVDDVVALLVIAIAYTDHVEAAALADRDRDLRARARDPRARRLAGARLPRARDRRLDRAVQVGNPARDHRSGDGPRDGRLRGDARRPRARHRARPVVPRAADPRACALRPPRRLGRHLAERARAGSCCTRGRATSSSRSSRSRTPAWSSTTDLLRRAIRSPITIGSSSPTWWASPSASSAPRGSHRARAGPPAAARRLARDGRGRRARGHRVHRVAADLEPGVHGRATSRRRSAGCSPRRSAHPRSAGSLFRARADPGRAKARQLARTAATIVDLALPVDPELDHVRGPDDAPVTLVEYGDFECPYCGRAEPALRELLAEFGDDLRYVCRHLPLPDVHPRAQLAAEASEAAGKQGAFWEMHDLLFEHQDALRPADLSDYARRAGPRRRALRARAAPARVRRAHRARHPERRPERCHGTPSFFVNGQRHYGAYDLASLETAVRTARQRAVLVPG